MVVNATVVVYTCPFDEVALDEIKRSMKSVRKKSFWKVKKQKKQRMGRRKRKRKKSNLLAVIRCK